MDKIKGTPEGRPGVWLIEADTAVALIDAAPGDTVHNFLGTGGLMVGADWDKESARDFVRNRAHRLALIFPPNLVARHHLIGLTDENRYAFDVGKIDEQQMEQAP